MIVCEPLFSPLQLAIHLICFPSLSTWSGPFAIFRQFWLLSWANAHSPTMLLQDFWSKLNYLENIPISIQLSLDQKSWRGMVGECALAQVRSQNWQNMAKGPDQVERLGKQIKGIANCSGLNRGSQTINYNI